MIQLLFISQSIIILCLLTCEAFQHHTQFALPQTALCLFQRQNTRKYDGDSSTQAEIRALFYLWNDALATGDSRIVAARYAEDAVLFPIDSDIPRMDPGSIQEYFDSFLIKKPQVFLMKGQIKIGKSWAQDS